MTSDWSVVNRVVDLEFVVGELYWPGMYVDRNVE